MRHIGINFLLVLLAAIISVAAGEALIRIFLPSFDPAKQIFFYKGELDKPTLGPPNLSLKQTSTSDDFDVHISFNKYGLRDHKVVSNGQIGDLYIVGDSFAFGWGVEKIDRFSNKLEEFTGRTIYNLATPGDFENYNNLLKHAIVLGAKIRHVVISICMENDLKLYKSAILQSNSPVKKNSYTITFQGLKGFLKTRSALYTFISSTIHRNPKAKSIAKKLGLITGVTEGFSHIHFDMEIINGSISKLLEFVKNFEPVFLVIPSRGLWVGEKQEITRKIHTTFVKKLISLGFDVIDMWPIFESAKMPMKFYFKNDGHWSPKGHHAAARALQAYFQEVKQ